MEVVLVKDIKNVGHTHDVIDVSDGHAANFLIPQRFAVLATPSTIRNAQTHKVRADAEREVQKQLIIQNLETLAEARIVIVMKANDKGHLYDAVGVPEIASAIKEQTKVELPEDTLRLEHPIKETGTFEIPVAHGESFGKFSIIIEAQEK